MYNINLSLFHDITKKMGIRFSLLCKRKEKEPGFVFCMHYLKQNVLLNTPKIYCLIHSLWSFMEHLHYTVRCKSMRKILVHCRIRSKINKLLLEIFVTVLSLSKQYEYFQYHMLLTSGCDKFTKSPPACSRRSCSLLILRMKWMFASGKYKLKQEIFCSFLSLWQLDTNIEESLRNELFQCIWFQK